MQNRRLRAEDNHNLVCDEYLDLSEKYGTCTASACSEGKMCLLANGHNQNKSM